jgi:hypothetical protein
MIHKYGRIVCFVDKDSNKIAVVSGKIKKEYNYNIPDKFAFNKGFFIVPLNSLQSKVFDPVKNKEYLFSCMSEYITVRKVGRYIIVHACNEVAVFDAYTHERLYAFDNVLTLNFQPSAKMCTIHMERLGVKQTVHIKQEGLVWN